MRGIYLVWKKTKANIEHGFMPYLWTTQDRKDAKRAVKWLGDFFDWVEWKAELKKEKAEKGDV